MAATTILMNRPDLLDAVPRTPSPRLAFLRRRLMYGAISLLAILTLAIGARWLGVRVPAWVLITMGLVLNDIVQPTEPGRLAWPRRERIRFALVSGAVVGGLMWAITAWLA